MDHSSVLESRDQKGLHFCSFEHYFHRMIKFLEERKKNKFLQINVAVFFIS